MPKVTLIVGLPGSGKTHLANRLAELDINENTVVFDDLPRTLTDLEQARPTFDAGKNLIFTHPALCNASIRVATEIALKKRWGATVDFIYFENDPDACLANCERRNDGRKVRNFIRDISKVYVIPEDTIKCRVWRPEDDPQE